jgi:hypothetical protein
VGSLSSDSKANQVESWWKRFAVHFDDLPVEGISNVRIGFDLMGPGQVNIDNVQVFDRWFDENDAKAITQMLASTGPLLSKPATFDSCRRLLASYWPSFLDQFIDIEAPAKIVPENESELNQNKLNQNPEASSTQLERGDDTANLDHDVERKVPMFRRIRNLVPQRK